MLNPMQCPAIATIKILRALFLLFPSIPSLIAYLLPHFAGTRGGMSEGYTPVPLCEEGPEPAYHGRRVSHWDLARLPVFISLAAILAFVLGFVVGKGRSAGPFTAAAVPSPASTDRNLSQQEFIPESKSHFTKIYIKILKLAIVPTKDVVFEFPTRYEGTGQDADRLWNDLMPGGLL